MRGNESESGRLPVAGRARKDGLRGPHQMLGNRGLGRGFPVDLLNEPNQLRTRFAAWRPVECHSFPSRWNSR